MFFGPWKGGNQVRKFSASSSVVSMTRLVQEDSTEQHEPSTIHSESSQRQPPRLLPQRPSPCLSAHLKQPRNRQFPLPFLLLRAAAAATQSPVESAFPLSIAGHDASSERVTRNVFARVGLRCQCPHSLRPQVQAHLHANLNDHLLIHALTPPASRHSSSTGARALALRNLKLMAQRAQPSPRTSTFPKCPS